MPLFTRRLALQETQEKEWTTAVTTVCRVERQFQKYEDTLRGPLFVTEQNVRFMSHTKKVDLKLLLDGPEYYTFLK